MVSPHHKLAIVKGKEGKRDYRTSLHMAKTITPKNNKVKHDSPSEHQDALSHNVKNLE